MSLGEPAKLAGLRWGRLRHANVLGRALLLAGACGVACAQGATGPGATAVGSAAQGVGTPQSATATVSAASAQGGLLRGVVVAGAAGKPGGVPLPGVSVTATNTLTGRKYVTATDVEGAYTMKIPRNGRYVVRAEIAGFAPATTEVVLNAETASTPKVSDFGLQLLSRVEAQEAKADAASGAGATGATGTASLLRNLQGLNLSASGGDAEDASAGSGSNAGAALPSLGSLGDAGGGSGADTVAVSGANGQTNGLANFSEDQLRERIQQGVEQARANGLLPPGVDPTNAIAGILGGMMGGPGGPGGGGGGRGGRGGGGGFGRGSGAFRNFNPTQLHGGLNFQGEYAALDSAPWSPTLTPQLKPSYAQNTFGGTLAGSPYLPGLTKPSTKQFGFLNFNVSRNTTPRVLTGTVPTDAQRGGDFSSLVQTVNGVQTGTPIYDPTTGAQFAFNGAPNVIDPARISPQALYVLNNFYPHANVAGTGTQRFNYQTVTTVGQNSANLSTRFIRNLGANSSGPFFGGGRFGGGGRNAPQGLRQSLNFNFSYSHSAQDLRNVILPLSGATQSDGYNFAAGYVIGRGRLNNTSTVTWNRSHADTHNYFTDTTTDPAAAAGIGLPSTGAIGFRPNFYNGLPQLTIENFLSVNNTNPQDNIAQTISFSDALGYRHKKHNFRFGVDVRRVHQDFLGGGTPLGQFTFTGFNTEAPCTRFPTQCGTTGTTGTSLGTGQTASGAAFADFLLGLPQQSEIQAGLSKIYLRENVVDWYANDDFRVANGITLDGGVRYEYFGPFSEKNNRLINLTGVTPLTTSVGCVTPGGLTAQTVAGTLTCAPGANASLLQPDRAMWSPRVGVAYRPHWVKDTVIRGGYGINFNTGQFATFARNLSYQAPFAATQNNGLNNDATTLTGCLPQAPGLATNFTLGSAFGCSGKLFENTYAVDPNYRLGLVQIYNVDLQRSLPLGIVLNLGYNGSHGSNLNVVNAPNHTPNGVTTPNAVAFTYQQSTAESTFNALTIGAQKRLQKGVQLGARYQYAHSIDDASSINGSTETASVQDPTNLLAERSNSSFDVRHSLSGTWLYELPVGPNRAFLSKGGVAAKVLDGFSLSGSFNITSGHYYTPSYQATAAQISAGGTYTLRPDRVFTQPIAGVGGYNNFFNAAAFTSPGAAFYGTASRYSIEGPGTLSVNASLSRTVPLGETRSFEARMTANNVFNTVQYSGIDTTLDSATFGQVTGAASMRQITFVGRFRF